MAKAKPTKNVADDFYSLLHDIRDMTVLLEELHENYAHRVTADVLRSIKNSLVDGIITAANQLHSLEVESISR